MSSVARPGAPTAPLRRLWVPHQHGAWAMIAVPILLGVAASRPDAWQLVLAVAAVAGYLASATAQAWLRARRRPSYVPSLRVYGAAFAAAGLALVASHPALLASAAVIVPAGAIVLAGARPGTGRDLAGSLGQAAIATVLAPAAAVVAGPFDAAVVAAGTAVGAAYLTGTVLVVRSVIRERGNERFAAFSIGFHALLLAGAVVAMPWPFAVVAAGLLARAAALPLIQRRRAGTPRPLRPAQVGLVEIVASAAVVAVAFAVFP